MKFKPGDIVLANTNGHGKQIGMVGLCSGQYVWVVFKDKDFGSGVGIQNYVEPEMYEFAKDQGYLSGWSQCVDNAEIVKQKVKERGGIPCEELGI